MRSTGTTAPPTSATGSLPRPGAGASRRAPSSSSPAGRSARSASSASSCARTRTTRPPRRWRGARASRRRTGRSCAAPNATTCPTSSSFACAADVILGVDVGGTFTDAVLAAGGRIVTAKAPTTPGDQSEGVMAAIAAALERAGAEAGAVEAFAHGMTVATNALLEGRGARTVLVATEGFTDVVELGRQARADLYRLCAARPAPLVPPQRRIAAPERTGPRGVLRALEDPDALARRIAEHEPEAIAVVLLHAYAHPEHERAIAAALERALPDAHVSLSHEVVGTFREYERAATTEVDAALSPLLARYLRRLLERAAPAGLPEPRIMQ